ncbi:hypothetical protein ES708_10272 [subsurface metagenome]
MKKPHIVILGADASRAVCPNGDKNGKILQLMNDLTEIKIFYQFFMKRLLFISISSI